MRSRSFGLKVLRSEQVAGEETVVDYERPRTRGECANAERPCPFVSCKHHLYLDVNEETGTLKINFPTKEPDELAESCALDVADRGGATLEEVGELVNVTRERVRQLETKALLSLVPEAGDLEDPPEHHQTPMAAMQVEEAIGYGGDRREVCRRAQRNYERRKRGLPAIGPTRDDAYIPRLNLPPPVPRALHRCRLCGVRTNEPNVLEHARRHGSEYGPEHVPWLFEPDDSVQQPVGRPHPLAMAKLLAKARREQWAAARVEEERERGEVRAPAPVSTPPKEKTTVSEYMTTAEAAKVLDVKTNTVSFLFKRGKIEGRKNGNGIRAPLELKRTSVESYAASRLEQPTAKPKRAAAPKPRKAPKPATTPAPAPPRDLASVIRALGTVVDLGKLDPADAFVALRELAA